MLQQISNLLRGLRAKATRHILPTVGNLIGKGVDLLDKFPISHRGYQNKVSDYLDTIHENVKNANKYLQANDSNFDYMRKLGTHLLIPHQPNASYGIGTWGSQYPAPNPGINNPSPAFIGDRQQIEENYERYPSLTDSYIMRSNKRIRKKHNTIVDEPIFRQTNKQMPLSLFLPSTERKPKTKKQYLRDEEKFGEMIYGTKRPRNNKKKKYNFKSAI